MRGGQLHHAPRPRPVGPVVCYGLLVAFGFRAHLPVRQWDASVPSGQRSQPLPFLPSRCFREASGPAAPSAGCSRRPLSRTLGQIIAGAGADMAVAPGSADGRRGATSKSAPSPSHLHFPGGQAAIEICTLLPSERCPLPAPALCMPPPCPVRTVYRCVVGSATLCIECMQCYSSGKSSGQQPHSGATASCGGSGGAAAVGNTMEQNWSAGPTGPLSSGAKPARKGPGGRRADPVFLAASTFPSPSLHSCVPSTCPPPPLHLRPLPCGPQHPLQSRSRRWRASWGRTGAPHGLPAEKCPVRRSGLADKRPSSQRTPESVLAYLPRAWLGMPPGPLVSLVPWLPGTLVP